MRLIKLPIRLVNKSQSKFGVTLIKLSRSANHSTGTSLSSQSAIEAQKTRGRAENESDSGSDKQLGFEQQDNPPGGKAVSHLRNSRCRHSMHSTKSPEAAFVFHMIAFCQLDLAVRLRCAPDPQLPPLNRAFIVSA